MRQFAANSLRLPSSRGRSYACAAAARSPATATTAAAGDMGMGMGALRVSDEIRGAVESCKPVVALESTIISHGLPYPRNLEVARQLEGVVRSLGAVPATVAVVGGVPCVGLTPQELELLALPGSNVLKASSRDLPVVCAQRRHAATTVASTTYLAHRAGIQVFATGGIGGVHRGAEVSMDISADLTELSRTPVTVVSSGIKSILDIPKTLEVLETLGVPVLGFGTKEFPGFYTNQTGIASPAVGHSAAEVASVMAWSRRMGMHAGMLVGVPNPSPPAENARIAEAIERAVLLAEQNGVRGNAVTPFVLSAIAKITGGKSVDSNVALVLNNAAIASQIAVEYAKLNVGRSHGNAVHFRSFSADTKGEAGAENESLRTQNERQQQPSAASESQSKAPVAPSSVCVVGGMVIDQVSSPEAGVGLVLGTSNPGSTVQSFGGVGRNVAEAIALQLSVEGNNTDGVSIVSAVGDDTYGDSIIRHSQRLGIDTSRVLKVGGGSDSRHRTASYTAVHDERGDLHVAVADMDIFKELSPSRVKDALVDVKNTKLIVADGNLSKETFNEVARISSEHRTPLFFEPTSVFKCTLPIHADVLSQVDILKPNEDELRQIIATFAEKYSDQFSRESLRTLRRALESPSAGGREDLADVVFLGGVLHEIMSVGDSQENFTRSSQAKGLVYGKHLLVSLGSKGIVWFGPADLVPSQPGPASRPLSEGSFGMHTRWMHFPAAPVSAPRGAPGVKSSAPMLVTNGAGDAFCGGFISSLISFHNQKGRAASLGRPSPDVAMWQEYYVSAIRRGLKAAADRIQRNSFK